ncbi:MAG: aspartate aminotransferase family protein [Elusimicrobiota bacterium]|jgi:4-aminobutyrate aminotransferase/(S)-3-amino-2-methylpropionate transaminase|nr:aspartate aminotransferase family protein [Elusimicrobiota bacterium]
MLRDELPNIKTELPGPKAQSIIARRLQAVPEVIGCIYPCVIKRGEGAVFEDVDGNIFLDWVAGVGVLNIGYSNPEIIEAVVKQAQNYFHAMQNIVVHEGYVSLAEKLNKIVPTKEEKRKTIFANSGAEAIENAVKIARSSTKRPNIIVFSGAFHGRTLLAATMTSKKNYYHGLGPLPDGIYRAEFPYLYRAPKGFSQTEAIDYYIGRLKAVFEEASLPQDVAAIVVEPVQGEGGFIPAPMQWVKAVRKICDDNGILLIADEVQTGFGRTGKMFASNYWLEWGCPPDIIAMSKSIAGGLPLAAVTAGASITSKITPGIIGGTFGGNALACAAALKVIEIMERDNIPQKALKNSEKIMAIINEWRKTISSIGDVRGLGCMMGVEFVKKDKSPYPELVSVIINNAVKKGLVIEAAGTYGNVIRILFPLIITDAQLERGLEIFKVSIENAVMTQGE